MPVSPGVAKYFSLLGRKKSTQKKGHPGISALKGSLTPANFRGPHRHAVHGVAMLGKRPVCLPPKISLRSAGCRGAKSGASWLAEPSKYHIYGPHIVIPALSRYPVSGVHYPRFDAGFRGAAVWCSINVGFYFEVCLARHMALDRD
jgi:hypothetical protein